MAARGQTGYSYRYWFDDDTSTRQQGTVGGSGLHLDADVSALTEGFHQLRIQMTDEAGTPSNIATKGFVKIPQVDGAEEFTCLFHVDNEFFAQQRVVPSSGLLACNVDVASLPTGFHHLMTQVVTPCGIATSPWQCFFYRESTRQEMAQMRCFYALDDQPIGLEAGTLDDGTFHFNLDVSQLSDGLHRITYQLVNDNGATTGMRSNFFVKPPLGGSGITEYWYWLNDQDGAPTKVHLAEREDPFSLIKLLPVESLPVRSALFQFVVKDGQPKVYAKNEFHLRFYDASGRFTDVTRQYVDENVSLAVTDATLLESGVRQATDRPAENDIRWYKVEAEAGDSLCFQLDRAATLQLFSPTGQELLAVSGSEATGMNGLYAEEDGVYYLALHDVTATNGSTLSIYYEHIDRHAVLRQDIAVVGNGGPSTITFQGNGFDELTSVDLTMGLQTIHATEIGHEGKATTSVKLDFTGAELGQYKAVFYFSDDVVTVENSVAVEEPLPAGISRTVSYASQFLLSQGNTYSYKVRNHCNQTAYDVPMTLMVYTTDASNLQSVTVDGESPGNYEEQSANDDIEGYPYMRRYTITRSLRPSTAEPLAVKVKTVRTERIYVYVDGEGGPSDPVTSIDPNDIYGYQDADGDKTLRDGRTQVYYTIEFENDPAFATAPAHDIYITDQLAPELFDLSTFTPTRLQIGDQEHLLTDQERERHAVSISLMPRIYAIAQLTWSVDEQTGLVSWHIESLSRDR